MIYKIINSNKIFNQIQIILKRKFIAKKKCNQLIYMIKNYLILFKIKINKIIVKL